MICSGLFNSGISVRNCLTMVLTTRARIAAARLSFPAGRISASGEAG
jgi:hypothetical protein